MSTRLLGLVLVLIVGAPSACGSDDEPPQSQPDAAASAPAPYDDPQLAKGQALFETNCAQCHGLDLRGTQSGPPFLDEIYVPSHHPDEAFFVAVQNGVQPHHWDFGAMPPIEGVDADEVAAIVAYVRARQQDAGITD